MTVQNTPLAASYNSYSLMAAAAAAAAQSGGQNPGAHPVGSLEALRATWHAPRLSGQEGWQPGSLGAQPGQPVQQQQQNSLYGQGLPQTHPVFAAAISAGAEQVSSPVQNCLFHA